MPKGLPLQWLKSISGLASFNCYSSQHFIILVPNCLSLGSHRPVPFYKTVCLLFLCTSQTLSLAFQVHFPHPLDGWECPILWISSKGSLCHPSIVVISVWFIQHAPPRDHTSHDTGACGIHWCVPGASQIVGIPTQVCWIQLCLSALLFRILTMFIQVDFKELWTYSSRRQNSGVGNVIYNRKDIKIDITQGSVSLSVFFSPFPHLHM